MKLRIPRYSSLLPALAVISLSAPSLFAANFVLQANDGATVNSFSSALNFKTGNTPGGTAVAPSSGNTYQTGAFRIRTPTATGNFTFAGDSLEIQAGLGMRNKTTGIITVNNLIVADTGVLELSLGGASPTGTLAGNITLNGTATILADNSSGSPGTIFTISSAISGTGGINTGNASLLLGTGPNQFATSVGTVILTGNNSFTGGAESNGVAGSTLRLGNANAVKNSTVKNSIAGGLTFSSGIGTFNLGGLAGAQNIALADVGATAVTLNVGGGINNNSSTYDGILSGTGGKLTKSGSGTLTLTNTNTYTGETTIKAGTLKVNTSTSISSSSSIIVGDAGAAVLDVTAAGITVGASQTLSGIGTVDADASDIVTVSGMISAGNAGVGTLTFDGGILTLNNFTKFTYGLGTSSDLVTLMNSGSLVLGSSIGFNDFTFTNSGGFGVGTYTLIGGASSFTGSLDAGDLVGTVDGLSSTLGMSGNNLVLNVVPEPNVAALLGGLGTLLLLRRRR
jgi:autotransporter-associated beta strand protein